MKTVSSMRVGLIAGGLAAILNPLILIAEVTLLFGLSIVRARQDSTGMYFGPKVCLFFGILWLQIPEMVWGFVFGAGHSALGRYGGRRGGAISGAIFWFLPAMIVLTEQGWFTLHGTWSEAVMPLAILLKEIATGLTIGYIVGGIVGPKADCGPARRNEPGPPVP